MTAILGISAFYHDSAAALIVDGRIVAAAQEERFTRKKYDHDFPVKSIDFCLQQAGLDASQLDYVGFYDKPFLKFERLLETYLAVAPLGFESFLQAMPLWLKQKLHLRREMNKGLGGKYKKRYVFTEHHESHSASAFFPSPFEEAAILTLDGVGEWATASCGYGRGNKIHIEQEMRFPHSIGLLYSAFTYYTGFSVNSGEYKLMGLAPYGEPKYVDLILEKIVDLKEDGSLRMDMSYFDYCHGLTMTSKKFENLFGGPPRKPDSLLTKRDMDIAASIQKVTEEVMLRSARHIQAKTGMKNLVLAGGVALNCVGNGRVLREGPFENIWIQPAAGDAGGALGVALFIWHQLLDNPRKVEKTDSQRGSLLGPAFPDDEIKTFLDSVGASYTHIAGDRELCDHIADKIAAGNVIGWFQGPMEFGPRALGSRSLIGDPRNPQMQTTMNVKVKFREGFRPFAPAVLAERAHEFFGVEKGTDSPYMLLVAPVREEKRRPLSNDDLKRQGIDKLKTLRSEVPAITHVDFSARIQTVDAQRHGLYHGVIESFYKKTGCPVIVNTSFNLGWAPIVCAPQEAYETFMASDVDVLCLGHYVLTKSQQRCHYIAEDVGKPDSLLADVWCSPNARADLRVERNSVVCTATGQKFPITNNIPQLFWPTEGSTTPIDVAAAAAPFNHEHPHPTYEGYESVRTVLETSRKDPFFRALDESIPYNCDVLEVGCGTGHLTNYLGVSCRRVIGADACLNSLRVAEEFRRENAVHRVRFVEMNIFWPCFKPGSFDVVIANTALDHTPNPYGGLTAIADLVKPGGHVVLSLRNKFGRMAGEFRDAIAARSVDSASRQASSHTIDEVLGWFDHAGLEFVRCLPGTNTTASKGGRGKLFTPTSRGTPVGRWMAQARDFLAGGNDGQFVMIARKLAPTPRPKVTTSTNGAPQGTASSAPPVAAHH